MSQNKREEVPRQCEHDTLPDGVHVFHAYISGSYCWIKIYNATTGRNVPGKVTPIRLAKGWKQLLFAAQIGAKRSYPSPFDKAEPQRHYQSRHYQGNFDL